MPGYLLIADRGNDRLLLVNGAKKVMWRYPTKRPAFPFNYDDDAFFSSDYRTIVSNEEGQQTIEILSFPAGRVLWHYGHPDAPGAAPGYLSNPDDAYLLPHHRAVVADIKNCRVIVISTRSDRIVRQIGTTGVCVHHPPSELASPNGDTPIGGGRLLVTEITGSWIDCITLSGKLLWSVRAPVAYPSDAQWLGHGRILLADYSSPGHILIMTRTGRVLWRWGPTGPDALDHPSLAIRLPNGLIAVNDDYNHRVLLIDRHTGKIVWRYGKRGVPGRSHGLLSYPDGLDFLPASVVRRSPAIARALSRRR